VKPLRPGHPRVDRASATPPIESVRTAKPRHLSNLRRGKPWQSAGQFHAELLCTSNAPAVMEVQSRGMEVPPPRRKEKKHKKERKRKKKKKHKKERKRKRSDDGHKKKRKKHKKRRHSESDESSSSSSASSSSSSSSSSVDVGALQAMLRRARGEGEGEDEGGAVAAARPPAAPAAPPAPAMSSLLAVVPPVSTGHQLGLREEKRVYRPFNSTEGVRQGDKDAMGRVLVGGARPTLSNLELLDKELHSKEERES
jgi:hypothetical protein